MPQIEILILVVLGMFAVLGGFSMMAHIYNLNNIKNKTVGNGQHVPPAGRPRRKSAPCISMSRLRQSNGGRERTCRRSRELWWAAPTARRVPLP